MQVLYFAGNHKESKGEKGFLKFSCPCKELNPVTCVKSKSVDLYTIWTQILHEEDCKKVFYEIKASTSPLLHYLRLRKPILASQDTGLGNRRPLKALNVTKLILKPIFVQKQRFTFFVIVFSYISALCRATFEQKCCLCSRITQLQRENNSLYSAYSRQALCNNARRLSLMSFVLPKMLSLNLNLHGKHYLHSSRIRKTMTNEFYTFDQGEEL